MVAVCSMVTPLKEVSFVLFAGQEYVIPVTGFFCKLCRKFYNSENSAKVIHCKSQAHFNNLKVSTLIPDYLITM